MPIEGRDGKTYGIVAADFARLRAFGRPGIRFDPGGAKTRSQGLIATRPIIAGAYYAGESHMGEMNRVAGQDQPGNTNHLTEREYADQVAPAFGEGMKHLSITDSHGERLDLQLTARVISHRKPNTQSRVKSRSTAR